MGERGVDVSEWQAGMDTEYVSRANGLSFAMVRTNYGSNHDDAEFHRHCDGFERAGVIVTPYVYPLATDTHGSIDDAVRIIGGRYDRCIVDWEVGSGGGDHLRAAHERVWEHGLRTPLVYDPAWYWQQQGSPNVDWLGQSGRVGGHWKSWYPDNVPGSFDEILKKLAASVWSDNRGGIPTRIVQFTSSGRLTGWGGNLDLNYFPGSRSELAELLTEGETVDWTDPARKLNEGTPNERVIDFGTMLRSMDDNTGLTRDGIARVEEKLGKIGGPSSVTLTEADRKAIADQVRLGLLSDLAPLFDLARRLES